MPGLLHHVIARGIERTEILRDDRGREVFVERLGELVPAGGAKLHAWALLSNRGYLVIKPGESRLPCASTCGTAGADTSGQAFRAAHRARPRSVCSGSDPGRQLLISAGLG